jgi:hypothetical protein
MGPGITTESWALSSFLPDPKGPKPPDAAGEYMAVTFLRSGGLGVVTTIQHEDAARFGFTWWRFARRGE